MAKDSLYFSHDMNARQDPKLQEVMMECGLAGVGAYWCIIEQLYEQDGIMPRRSYKTIAFSLHCEVELIRQIVEDFGLFAYDDDNFWSEAVNRRNGKRKELSEKRKEAIAKRWEKPAEEDAPETENTPNNTNVIQTKNNCITNELQNDTIKENKIKEIKENKTKSVCNNAGAGARTSVTPAPQTQDFLEIFFFEKNIKDPIGEVQRFIAHYEADGWCRKGNKEPVKDRRALARIWKPQTEGARFNEKALQWLSEVYAKAKANTPAEAIRIMAEVFGMSWEVGDGITIRLYCTPQARQVIDANFVYRRGLTLKYQLKTD